jgi:hypothetical protein
MTAAALARAADGTIQGNDRKLSDSCSAASTQDSVLDVLEGCRR